MSGVDILNSIQELSAEPVIAIVFTGSATSSIRAEVARSSAINYIEKKLFITSSYLDETIEEAIQRGKSFKIRNVVG